MRHYLERLKYCTSRSCFAASARVAKVPRFRRVPLRGSFFREYSRYWPDLSLRIISFGPYLCVLPTIFVGLHERQMDFWIQSVEGLRVPCKVGQGPSIGYKISKWLQISQHLWV